MILINTITLPMCVSISQCLLLPLRFRLSFSNLSLFSTSTLTNSIPGGGNKHGAMTLFLLTECGFPESQLPTIQRRQPRLFKSKSTHTAQQALQLFKDSGFTLEQVRKTILAQPSLLQLNADEVLKPKLEFMKTLGLTDNDVIHIISRRPRILTYSLVKSLRPKISKLLNLYGSKYSLSKALARNPTLLLINVDRQLEPLLNVLKQSGIHGDLLLCLLTKGPQVLFWNSEESLKLKIEFILNMGILEGSKTFIAALFAVDNCGLKNLEKKLNAMRNIGLLEDEIKLILKKFPHILSFSIDKLQKNMNFLTHTAGFQPNIAVTYPVYLTLSIENRMNPRYKVLEYLRSIQPCQPLPSLAVLFHLSEQKFVEKFLSDNSYTAKLYENYKCKSVNL